ncbi:MAG: phosphatidate cytidylyltransferase [Rhizobiales bacterium]|nr:phosphatidate cytidylyltransferase [Hyphomicrobiales bacterium]
MAAPGETQPAKWSDLGIRALSAAVLIPAVLVDVWVGGAWFTLMVALLAVLMAQEWTAIAHAGDPLQFALHAAGALSGAFLPPGSAILAIAALTALSAWRASASDRSHIMWRYLGVPYVSLPAVALVLLHSDPAQGAAAIMWLLAIVWAADTLAYFSGRIIGGPKLAPVISPKKTWAGLGGAILGSAVAAAIFALVTGIGSVTGLAILAGLLAIVEQAGDLFKSALKRHYGVKDSGRIIPGHGGIIDRVDGLVAVATVGALIGLLHGGIAATGAGLLAW